jgi:hypothetical protein
MVATRSREKNQLCVQVISAGSLHISGLEESLLDSDSDSENSIDDYVLNVTFVVIIVLDDDDDQQVESGDSDTDFI